MNYAQTIDWLFEKLPMYQRQGAASYKPNLNRIHNLCEYLRQPHSKFPSIHVAGTNGKGSTCHMIASILQTAGYKVGLYTSPHLHDFRERIRLNGEKISKQNVIDFVAQHQHYFETHQMSFFEMTVGMAFDFFSKQSVDIAVVEVGLGGRLDATNVLSPEVCVITNIGLDHTQFLGSTLREIAREKAGIIKENIPVVIGEYQKETYPVFEEIANQKNAEIHLASEQIKQLYMSDLRGLYQAKNTKTAVQAVRLIKQLSVSESQIKMGLKQVVSQTGLKGRWSVVSDYPKVIMDVAHNFEGLSLVMHQLGEESFEKLHIVFGSVSDKSLERIFSILPKEAQYYFCAPVISRAMSVSSLERTAQEYKLSNQAFDSVTEAYRSALKNASPSDLVFVGGSTFVVAEVD
jgi:dihydrofolate synthase/folylpolyglutamate synthase